MLEVRNGQATGLSIDERFTRRVQAARDRGAIWGVALGPAVGDWFKGWMPTPRVLQLDWPRVFQNVEALTYSVDAAESVSLDLRLDCTTAAAATSLRQLLDGLRLAQQMAWQNQNPNQPSPFEGAQIEASDRQVRFQVDLTYEQIEAATRFGTP